MVDERLSCPAGACKLFDGSNNGSIQVNHVVRWFIEMNKMVHFKSTRLLDGSGETVLTLTIFDVFFNLASYFTSSARLFALTKNAPSFVIVVVSVPMSYDIGNLNNVGIRPM